MFQTLDGLRIVSLSVDQMREVDRIAMEETGPTLLQMMENAELIHWANVCPAPVLSLDVPSGLNADTGALSYDTAAHPCIRATKTLTLVLPKRGLVAACVGELWLADIGIPRTVFQQLGLDVQLPFSGTAKIRLNIRGDSPVFPGSPFG